MLVALRHAEHEGESHGRTDRHHRQRIGHLGDHLDEHRGQPAPGQEERDRAEQEHQADVESARDQARHQDEVNDRNRNHGPRSRRRVSRTGRPGGLAPKAADPASTTASTRTPATIPDRGLPRMRHLTDNPGSKRISHRSGPIVRDSRRFDRNFVRVQTNPIDRPSARLLGCVTTQSVRYHLIDRLVGLKLSCTVSTALTLSSRDEKGLRRFFPGV